MWFPSMNVCRPLAHSNISAETDFNILRIGTLAFQQPLRREAVSAEKA
jgi:hypothetical protein